MGLFTHKQLFCTLCKKSITHKQKPQHNWNLEGYLCGDCYMSEMLKQCTLEEEVKAKELKPNKIKAGKSPKSVKWDYYFGVFTIIASSYLIISGLTKPDSLWVLIGVPCLIISLIQFTKRRKAYARLSKNKDSVSENESSPLITLKMRLAKGEITKEEFNKIKEDLKD